MNNDNEVKTRIFYMSVKEAYEMSQHGSQLADKIREYKEGLKPDDRKENNTLDNSEYNSWKTSPPKFLAAVMSADLGDLDVAFEVPTPTGDYIDAVLIGRGKTDGSDRLLLVEYNAWTGIRETGNANTVKVSEGTRIHPVLQIIRYEKQMKEHHSGIVNDGKIKIDSLLCMHEFSQDKSVLFQGKYEKWTDKYLSDNIYIKGEGRKLSSYLSDTFASESNPNLIEILKNNGYKLGKAGFEGFVSVLQGDENAIVVGDQKEAVDLVVGELKKQQKEGAKKEIIVISGGPGTGKTIVGMHFIYDYADIFNGGTDADGAVFCLPRSRTVKAVIDNACNANVVPYLDNIDRRQNLVVVDEAHRITNLRGTLDGVFGKGTKLLILLQDDHQRIRPGEDGTFENIKRYAEEEHIEFKHAELTTQRRCEALGALVSGLKKMFYGKTEYGDRNSLKSVFAFDKLEDMDKWITKMSKTSRAKFLAPYCWTWKGGKDVCIEDKGYRFEKYWNPGNLQEQVRWFNGNGEEGKVASIYTSQGLDFDDIGFIWWDDLKWNKTENKWKADLSKSKDGLFVKNVNELILKGNEYDAEKQINDLFINTYYVMLSRARNKLGIWFHDEDTKQHVIEMLGLEKYSPYCDNEFNAEDGYTTTVNSKPRFEEKSRPVIGNRNFLIFHKDSSCPYCPRDKERQIVFKSAQDAVNAGYRPCYTCRP